MTETMPPQINGLLPREELSGVQRDEMFLLLSEHFEGVTREQFERDLEEKNWVIEIRRHGRLLGFSTLLVAETEFDGEMLTVIYSGDTIVAPEAWRSSALPRTWIAAVNALRERVPSRRCYWLLLTSGFRTYRFLPVFWCRFFPRHGVPTPPREEQLLHHLAATRYGIWYDFSSGIVRFPYPQKLRGQIGAVPRGREGDPDISFFLARNSGYANGDELACLTEISDANLTAAGRRMVS